jgi:hypothetical protein
LPHDVAVNLVRAWSRFRIQSHGQQIEGVLIINPFR